MEETGEFFMNTSSSIGISSTSFSEDSRKICKTKGHVEFSFQNEPGEALMDGDGVQ